MKSLLQTRELCSGSMLRERVAGASSLVCTDLRLWWNTSLTDFGSRNARSKCCMYGWRHQDLGCLCLNFTCRCHCPLSFFCSKRILKREVWLLKKMPNKKNKNQGRNAFYFFMVSLKPQLERQGVILENGMQTLAEIAGPRWKVCCFENIRKSLLTLTISSI